MNKIALIGVFPLPIHGMSLANQYLFDFFNKDPESKVSFFDINLSKKIKNKKDQGRFLFGNFFLSIINTIHCIFYIFRHRGWIFYITPPQSIIGYVRVIPIIFISWMFGKSVIVHFHGSLFALNVKKTNLFLRYIIKKSFFLIDKIILLGDSIRTSHKEIIPKSKLYTCFNGVDVSDQINTRVINNNKIKILFLSNLMEAKGIFDFLSAIKSLDLSKYQIDIAGEIEEANKDKIELIFLGLLSDNIKYHGVVSGDYKSELLNNADIFVLPSYDEGQPLSILEAYGHGCSVITTNVGGIPDIFKDNINGLFCDVSDPASILKSIYDLSESKLILYSKNNILEYKEKYTKEKYCLRIKSLIL